MKRLIAGLALALFIASPVAAGQASITAPDGLRHGDTFMPTWSGKATGGAYLYATIDCVKDGVHVQSGPWVDLGGTLPGNAGPFTLGTSLWTEGGADCSIRMFTFDASSGRTRDLASDGFTVLP